MSDGRGPGAPFGDVVDGLRREGLLEAPPPAAEVGEPHEGTGRVQLTFEPAGRTFRVPPGVSVFDMAGDGSAKDM